MHRDLYIRGKPLTRKGLFQLLGEEVLRDGVVSPQERDVVLRVARFLRLQRDEARDIFALCRRKQRAGLLGEGRPLQPRALYETVLSHILSDWKLDPGENQMILGLRKLFRVDLETHLDLMERIMLPDGISRAMPILPAGGGPEESPPGTLSG